MREGREPLAGREIHAIAAAAHVVVVGEIRHFSCEEQTYHFSVALEFQQVDYCSQEADYDLDLIDPSSSQLFHGATWGRIAAKSLLQPSVA